MTGGLGSRTTTDQLLRCGSAVLGWFGVDKLRRDVVLASFVQGRVRLGLCIAFMPSGYSLLRSHVDEAPVAPAGKDEIGV